MYLIKFHIELVRIYLQMVYQNIFNRVSCFGSCFRALVFCITQTRNHQAWTPWALLQLLDFFAEKFSSIGSCNCWGLWLLHCKRLLQWGCLFFLLVYWLVATSFQWNFQNSAKFLVTLVNRWCWCFHLIAISCLWQSFITAFTHDCWWTSVLSLINVFF